MSLGCTGVFWQIHRVAMADVPVNDADPPKPPLSKPTPSQCLKQDLCRSNMMLAATQLLGPYITIVPSTCVSVLCGWLHHSSVIQSSRLTSKSTFKVSLH
eukprot:3556563-Amphidinium_carterae.1